MHVVQTASSSLRNICLTVSFFLTSFDRSQKFRTVIYFTFGVLLQDKRIKSYLYLKTLETEYTTLLISIYHSLDDNKKCNFKTLF